MGSLSDGVKPVKRIKKTALKRAVISKSKNTTSAIVAATTSSIAKKQNALKIVHLLP